MRRTEAASLFLHSPSSPILDERRPTDGPFNHGFPRRSDHLRRLGAEQEQLALGTPVSGPPAAEPLSDQRRGYGGAHGEADGGAESLRQIERQGTVDRAVLRGWLRRLLAGTVSPGVRHRM